MLLVNPQAGANVSGFSAELQPIMSELKRRSDRCLAFT